MSYSQIILAIISSSVLSAILTSIFNWILHNANYKKDFYKKILDKRLIAYESLNTLINKLSNITQLEDDVIHSILFDDNLFTDYLYQLIHLSDNTFWLGEKTGHKVTELHIFLFNNISNYIDDDLSPELKEKKYHELGVQHFETIRTFKKELKVLMNQDLKQLHKVDLFFDNNEKIGPTYPVYGKKV